MTPEVSVIKLFSKFLNPEISKKVKSIKDILNLPISAFKFLNEEEIAEIADLFKVTKINEAAELNKEDPFTHLNILMELDRVDESKKAKEEEENLQSKIQNIREKYPNFEEKLKKTVRISSIIKSIKEESIVEKKREQKITVVGLDNAGKTAILSKFGGHLGINDLASLKPTKGIERKHIKTDTLDLFIWDFGGQELFRKRYFEDPEKYFMQIDLLIYVIDVQDSDRFESSIRYFKDILDILIALEEKPYFLIFIHKYDPDLRNDPAILLNVESLKTSLKEIFQERKDSAFDYEIYLTSIFSLLSREPKFAKFLKEVMKTHYDLTDPTINKVEGLGKILEETMNAVIRLSESISTQINNIENRLAAIESGAYEAFQLKSVQSGVPIEIKSPEVIEVNRGGAGARSQVLDELKNLFAKKRSLDL